MSFKKQRKYTNITDIATLSIYQEIETVFSTEWVNFKDVKVNTQYNEFVLKNMCEKIFIADVASEKKRNSKIFGASININKNQHIVSELVKFQYLYNTLENIATVLNNMKIAESYEKKDKNQKNSSFQNFFQFKYYQYFMEKNFRLFRKHIQKTSTTYDFQDYKTKTDFYQAKYVPLKNKENKGDLRVWKKSFYVKPRTQSYKLAFLLVFKKRKNSYQQQKIKRNKFFVFKGNNKTRKKLKISRKTFKPRKNAFYQTAKKRHNRKILRTNRIISDKNSTSLERIYGLKNQKIKKRISALTGFQSSLIRINFLAFARFEFNYQKHLKKRKKRKNRWQLNKIQNDSTLYRDRSDQRKINWNAEIQKTRKIAIKQKLVKKKKKKWVNPKKIKNSRNFIKRLERERTKRYQYTAIQITNIVRILFIAFFSKNAQLIANFFALILNKLPRNRKETKFIRVFNKIRKMIATQRQEMTGIRRRFQGRINRWRRTKHIVQKKGNISFNSYNQAIAYGRAQGITRKGAFGIRIWIGYEQYFPSTYKKAFYAYRNNSEKKIFINDTANTSILSKTKPTSYSKNLRKQK